MIPFQSIRAYADAYGFDGPGEFDRLFRLIRALDADYVRTINKRD